MTLNTALSAAVSGLGVNQVGLEIASHNIANVNTEGYSRRIGSQEAADDLGVGSRGVIVSGIKRVADSFLSEQVREQSAPFGRSEVRDRYFTDTQDLFGTIASNNSIGQRLTDMTTRMEALAVDPESPTAASALLDDAAAFARDLNTISDEIVELRRKADLEVDKMVDDINTDLVLVAELNAKIMNGRAAPGPAVDIGDMEDQRDQALLRIGEKLNIKTFERSTGEIVVFTGDARMLVDGDAVELAYDPTSTALLGTTFSDITLADGTSIQGDIRDGALKGLLEVRDDVLPNLHLQMDALAENARDIANAVHNRGVGLPAADSLTGSRSFADTSTDTVTTGSDTRFVVMGAGGGTVAVFDLPAGTFTIDDLAAAIDVGLDVNGTAAVVGGVLTISTTDPNNGVGLVDLNGGDDMAISFDDGSGAQAFEGFSAFFGLNDFFQTPGVVLGGDPQGISGGIGLRSDILTNPERMSRGRLSTDVTPPVPGTDVAVAIGDGSIMAELGAAFSRERSIGAVGGLPPINKPLHEYAGEILGHNAQLASDEKERLAFQEALVEQFTTRLTDVSGVNMDEELANILVLQNAFAASARVVTTVDEMMEIITNLKR